MKKFIDLMFILLLFQCTAIAQSWQWQNPLPHGLLINDVYMMDGYRAFAVCDNGYFMRSGDGGRTWETYSIGNENLQHIIQTPNNRLIITADRQQVLISDDFGTHWTLQYQVGTKAAGFYSDIVMLGDTLGIAILGPGILVKTINSGITWEMVAQPARGSDVLRSVALQSPSDWWLTTNSAVYRSSDAGKNWFEDKSYSASNIRRFVFLDSLNGYQLRNGQLLRTKDGASTWEEMDIFGFGDVIDIAADPRLGQSVYCLSVGNYLVNASTDAGQTWNVSLTESAFPDASPSAISFASPSLGLVAGEGGRILRTEDGGASWSIVHGIGYGGSMMDVLFTSPQNGMALSVYQTMLWTSNGGSRWNQAIPVPPYSLRALSMYSETSGFAFGVTDSYDFSVFRTTDVGKTWALTGKLPIPPDIFQSLWPMGILALSQNEVWVSASYGTLYKSTNGGVNFDSTTVSPELMNEYQTGEYLFYFPPDTLIYGSSVGDAVSVDRGKTWRFYSNNFGYLTAEQYVSPTAGFHILNNNFGKTTDGGLTWKESQKKVLLLFFLDANNGYVQTTDANNLGAVEFTSDGGKTWESRTLREKVYWRNWFFMDKNHGWVTGEGGMIRHTTDGGLTFAEGEPAIADDVVLGQSYPNPLVLSQGVPATIPFSFSGKARNVRLSIWNMLGEVIAVPIERMFEPGRHAVIIDAGRYRLKPGMYFYRLQIDASEQTKRFIVMN